MYGDGDKTSISSISSAKMETPILANTGYQSNCVKNQNTQTATPKSVQKHTPNSARSVIYPGRRPIHTSKYQVNSSAAKKRRDYHNKGTLPRYEPSGQKKKRRRKDQEEVKRGSLCRSLSFNMDDGVRGEEGSSQHSSCPCSPTTRRRSSYTLPQYKSLSVSFEDTNPSTGGDGTLSYTGSPKIVKQRKWVQKKDAFVQTSFNTDV